MLRTFINTGEMILLKAQQARLRIEERVRRALSDLPKQQATEEVEPKQQNGQKDT